MTDADGTTTSLATRVETVRTWLTAPERTAELAKVLPKGMTPEHFTRVVMTSCIRTPSLAQCSLQSLWLGVMEAAQSGLELDGRQAALVPYSGHAKFVPMYQGLLQAAYKHPRVVEVRALPVFEGETYKYSEGLRTVLEHVPGPSRDPSKLIAAYAVAKISGGGRVVRWMWREEIEAHRARSRARGDSAWTTDYVEMCVKTPIRAIAKLIPQSSQLVMALSAENDPERETPPGSPPVPHGATVTGVLDAIGDHIDNIDGAS